MVVFICSVCGDSLTKNKVDKHLWRCHTKSLSCVDCLKDFTTVDYSTHFECITEDQKYGGKNYKQPEFKGKIKQEAWIQKIKTLIQNNQFSPNIQHILKSLITYNNIPKKKAKFVNFVKNSLRIRDEKLIEQIWEVFDSAVKENNQNEMPPTNQGNSNNNNIISNTNKMKRKENDIESITNDEQLKKLKPTVLDDNEIPNENDNLKMKDVIKDILNKKGTMKMNKLQKKVLQFYQRHGYTNDDEIVNKYSKVIQKKKFIINENLVSLSN